MSRRLVCTGVGRVAWSEIPRRELTEGEVRVRNRYGVEKHGTMLAFFKGYANERGRWDAEARVHRPEGELWSYPIPLGNMQVGEVIEGPGVGRTVYFGGAFQEESVVSDYRELPDGVDWRTAMLFDPAEFALGAVRDGHVRAGDDVAVSGLGAIGLVTVQMVKLAGARVFALDPVAARREVALATGAHAVLDPTDGDAGMRLRELTGMRGVDVAIDFSGAWQALQAAFRGVGYGGTIVYGAFPPPFGAGLDFGGEAHMNRPKVIFSRACSDPNPDHPRWDWARIQGTVAGFIADGRLDGTRIVDEPVPFDSLLTEYPRLADEPEAHLKLSVVYP
ncbi:zinc-binding alcohol dehydrogenase [bacterium]|nr:MAG: zinc-binding alcohol dehydrogenase [bacterium]